MEGNNCSRDEGVCELGSVVLLGVSYLTKYIW